MGEPQPQHTHTGLIVNLLTDILHSRAKRDSRLDHLKRETRDLLFHSGDLVRRAFSDSLRDTDDQRTLAVSYVKKRLEKFRFRLDETDSSGGPVLKRCVWHEMGCSLAHRQARLVALVPQCECLAEGPRRLTECMQDHVDLGLGSDDTATGADPPARTRRRQALETARRHSQNFDMLVELSPQGKRHVLDLFAYQYKPFPFCITEAVGDRRLLEFLLGHRQNQLWLGRTTLLLVLKQVVEALTFLKQRNIVQRDITAFNMVVQATRGGLSRCARLPSGHFTVKLADLALAYSIADPVYQGGSAVKGTYIHRRSCVSVCIRCQRYVYIADHVYQCGSAVKGSVHRRSCVSVWIRYERYVQRRSCAPV